MSEVEFVRLWEQLESVEQELQRVYVGTPRYRLCKQLQLELEATIRNYSYVWGTDGKPIFLG